MCRWRRLYALGGRGHWPPSAAGRAGVHRRECRRLAAETKGDRTPMVSCPLLTPLTFLRTRLPAVARLNARGPQGRLLLQGHTLDGSRAFRSANQAPCTVWPRTVMRGGLRKVNSGPDSVPKAARRTEPSPRNPRFAARPKGVAAQRKVRGVKRGKETTWCPCPSCPGRWAPTSPPPDGGIAHAMSWRTSPGPGGPVSPAAASRRNGGTAYPLLRVKIEGPCFGLDPLPPPCYNK